MPDKPARSTLQANPSDASESPEHPVWVSGKGCSPCPDEERFPENVYGTFDEMRTQMVDAEKARHNKE